MKQTPAVPRMNACRVAVEKVDSGVGWCRRLVSTVDLTRPHLWYPLARAMQRRFIYHAGPTNSGKTYEALQVHTLQPHPPLLALLEAVNINMFLIMTFLIKISKNDLTFAVMHAFRCILSQAHS